MREPSESEREVVVTRVLDAPREAVWGAWTDPDQLTRWWGPDGFSTTTHEMDVRPGGVWRFTMHGPDGRDYPNRVTFDEVARAERLVFTHDDDGGAAEPVSFITTVTFEPHGDGGRRTKLTLRQLFPTPEERERVNRDYGAVEGGLQTLERLAGHVAPRAGGAMVLALPDERTILLRRVFDAPRDLVWTAWTDADHIVKWWGPGGFTTRVEALDFRTGGRLRYVMVGPDGKEYPSEGVFREIVPGERIVTTDEIGECEHFDPADLPDGVLVTTSFESDGGRTRVTVRIDHPDEENRRKHLALGIDEGFASMLDCLDEHLAALARGDETTKGANA